jgi:ribosomal protein L13
MAHQNAAGDWLGRMFVPTWSGDFANFLDVTSAAELLQRHPTDLITKAVKGMLPKNRMQEHLLKKFKVFAGAEHPHAAQQPKTIEI